MNSNKKALAPECTGQCVDGGNSSIAQRERILSALHETSLTTFEARRQLDVPHPAARVMELRRAGYDIATFWTDDYSDAGQKHRIARYVLLGRSEYAQLALL